MKNYKKRIFAAALAMSGLIPLAKSYNIFSSEKDDNSKFYVRKEYSSLNFGLTDPNLALNTCTSIRIQINDFDDLSFINECKNLEELNLVLNCTSSDWKYIRDNIENNVNFEKLQKLKTVNIYITGNSLSLTINKDNFGFLYDVPNVENMWIITDYISEDFFEGFPKLEKLTIGFINNNGDINYKVIPNLKEINILNKPYDAAIFMTKDDIDYLNKRNIKIKFLDENNKVDKDWVSKFFQIDNDLDKIMSQLNIDSSDSDEEKVRKISMYILKSLHYDSKASEYIEKSEQGDIYADDQAAEYLKKELYNDGYISAALYNSGSAVCGNYSNLFHALCKRAGIESYVIVSPKHAWNLVKLDDTYYYHDLTFCDRSDDLTYDILNDKNLTIDDILGINLFEDYQYKINIENNTTSSHFAINFPDEIGKNNMTYNIAEINDAYKIKNYQYSIEVGITNYYGILPPILLSTGIIIYFSDIVNDLEEEEEKKKAKSKNLHQLKLRR